MVGRRCAQLFCDAACRSRLDACVKTLVRRDEPLHRRSPRPLGYERANKRTTIGLGGFPEFPGRFRESTDSIARAPALQSPGSGARAARQAARRGDPMRSAVRSLAVLLLISPSVAWAQAQAPARPPRRRSPRRLQSRQRRPRPGRSVATCSATTATSLTTTTRRGGRGRDAQEFWAHIAGVEYCFVPQLRFSPNARTTSSCARRSASPSPDGITRCPVGHSRDLISGRAR